jgi:hypothetical protein
MRNIPRLWNFKGGYQHCKDLLMILSLDNFLQVCAQLSTGKTISVVFVRKKRRNGHAVTCGVADARVGIKE